MAVPSYIEAAQSISDPSPQIRVAALKHLKSAVIGHDDKKEDLIRQGILDVLVNVLQDAAKVRGKRRDQSQSGHGGRRSRATTLGEEEEARHGAIVLIGSFAHAGPAFVPPIIASGAIPHLCESLSPLDNHHSVVTTTLKALNILATSSLRCLPQTESLISAASQHILYSTASVRSMALIIAAQDGSRTSDKQIQLLSRLLRITKPAEEHCNALLYGGALDFLSARLASYYIHSTKYEAKNLQNLAVPASNFPPVSRQTLAQLLAAINAVVGRSKYRLFRFIVAPLARNVFTLTPPEATTAHALIVDAVERQDRPKVEGRETAHSRRFPALTSKHAGASKEKLREKLREKIAEAENVSRADGYHSTLSAWLLSTIKNTTGVARSQAALLLARMFLSGLYHRDERLFSSVIVPYLLSTLDENTNDMTDEEAADVTTMPLSALSHLVREHPSLQRAANEAGAIMQICTILRRTFEPVYAEPTLWIPNRRNNADDNTIPSRTLGPKGLNQQLHWVFERRGAALHLLAAIASKDDKQRQAFLDVGVTHNIIDAMKPLDEEALRSFEQANQSSERPTLLPHTAVGNPISVLIAACSAAKSLSRSVGLLRTTLSDAGLVAPTLKLLKFSDLSVRKAATDVIINLNPEFSPTREDVVDAGAIKILCEHAHSADPKLRLLSLWALKHLVYQTPNPVKLNCFEELGAGWLVQIITGNSPVSAAPVLPTPQDMADDTMDETLYAAPVQGSSSNAPSPPTEPQDDYGTTAISLFQLPHTSPLDITIPILPIIEILRSVQAREQRDTEISKLDLELNIQRQGLDFIRNLMMGPNNGEMVDHVLQSIGSNELFAIVSQKIEAHAGPTGLAATQHQGQGTPSAPAATPSFPTIPQWGSNALSVPNSGRATPSTPSFPPTAPGKGPIFTSPQMLHSAIMTLVHIAAGTSAQRQLLVSQTKVILAPLLNLLSHPEPQVRTAVVWCINNLTWVDDRRDEDGARLRALELRRQGFWGKLEEMGRAEGNVDCRERVQTGREQMRRLLEGVDHRLSMERGGMSGVEVSGLGGDLGVGRGGRR